MVVVLDGETKQRKVRRAVEKRRSGFLHCSSFLRCLKLLYSLLFFSLPSCLSESGCEGILDTFVNGGCIKNLVAEEREEQCGNVGKEAGSEKGVEGSEKGI